MFKPSKSYHRKGVSNLQSAGMGVAGFIWETADKAVGGLIHLASNDYSGMSRMLGIMPHRGFIEGMRFIAHCLIVIAVDAILKGILIFLFIGYGIPYLIYGHF